MPEPATCAQCGKPVDSMEITGDVVELWCHGKVERKWLTADVIEQLKWGPWGIVAFQGEQAHA